MQGYESTAVRLDSVRTERLRALESELGVRLVPLSQGPDLAELSEEQHARLRVLEREIGVSLVAYDANPQIRLAEPTQKQLEQLEAAERQLGFILVAYQLLGADAGPRRPLRPDDGRLATLSDRQHARLRKAEEELDLLLMAVHD